MFLLSIWLKALWHCARTINRVLCAPPKAASRARSAPSRIRPAPGDLRKLV